MMGRSVPSSTTTRRFADVHALAEYQTARIKVAAYANYPLCLGSASGWEDLEKATPNLAKHIPSQRP
jgi:hypothetical protein